MKTTRLMLIMLAAVALAGCGMLSGSGDSPATDENAELSAEVDCLETPLDPACTAQDEGTGEAVDDDASDVEDADDADVEKVAAILILDEGGASIGDGATFDDGMTDTAMSKSFAVSGATGAVSWTAENLPEGASSTPSADGSSVVVSWTPTHSGKFKFSLTASDEGSGLSKKASVTVKVHEFISVPRIIVEGSETQYYSNDKISVGEFQKLVLEMPNHASKGYTFAVKGNGYAIDRKPCVEGEATCRVVLEASGDSHLNRDLGPAEVTITNDVGDKATLSLAGVTFVKIASVVSKIVADSTARGGIELNQKAIDRANEAAMDDGVSPPADVKTCKMGKVADIKEAFIYPLYKNDNDYDGDVKHQWQLMANGVYVGETEKFKVARDNCWRPDDESPELSIAKWFDGETCIEEINQVQLRHLNPDRYTYCFGGVAHKADVNIKKVVVEIVVKADESLRRKEKAYYSYINEAFGKDDIVGDEWSWLTTLIDGGITSTAATAGMVGGTSSNRSFAPALANCEDVQAEAVDEEVPHWCKETSGRTDFNLLNWPDN